MKKEIELRFYLINIYETPEDFNFVELKEEKKFEEIINESERQGNVYSQQGFEYAFNTDRISQDNYYILIR